MAQHLSRRTKLLYGSGDIGFSLTTTIIGAYLAIFLTDVVGISPGAVGTAIFIGSTWDYINDPIMGFISDRTRSRWGRRRPFLLFGALPFALAFAMLWWRPSFESELWLAVYYAAAYVVFDSAATLIYMPYFALTPELTSDYDERTSLTSYRMFFSILGSLIAFTVPLFIIGAFEPANAWRVAIMGGLFALISALPMLLVFFGTTERPEYMQQEKPGLRQSLRIALMNRPFVFGLLIYLMTWLSVTILQGTLLYYIKYVVEREGDSELIMATIFVTAILVLPLWNWIARRWSKRLAYIGGIAFWAAVQMVMITLTPASSLTLIMVLSVLAGIGVSAAHVLPWAIIPDAIEWGELQTGERHEGMFYSLVTLLNKIAGSIAIPAVLWVLELTGYNGLSDQQPLSALLGIRVAIGPIPAVLLGLGILFALLYPLSPAKHAAVVSELERRRSKPGAHPGGVIVSQTQGTTLSAIDVRPVRTARDRRIFLTFPWRIYRNDPLWVPPLLPERARAIDPARGSFFGRGEAEFFIAWRDGQPVGTICAAEDPPTNARRGTNECVWGFFECVDDEAVAAALFEQVKAWAAPRGLNALYGPFNLDYEDGYGVLIEGRERPPALMCGHSMPYYQRLVEGYGFEAGRADNLAYAFDLGQGLPDLQRVTNLAERIRKRRDFSIRSADLSQWDAEIDRVHYLLQHALGHLQDSIPWHRDALESMLEPFRSVADPELILFAESDGRAVGWFPGVPNLNEHFKKANGLRYPWNYLQLAFLMRRPTECLAIKSVLVLPEYWNTGLAVLLFDEMARRAIPRGYKWVDLSITSEDNPQTPKLATRLGATLYKRWRVYRLRI